MQDHQELPMVPEHKKKKKIYIYIYIYIYKYIYINVRLNKSNYSEYLIIDELYQWICHVAHRFVQTLICSYYNIIHIRLLRKCFFSSLEIKCHSSLSGRG